MKPKIHHLNEEEIINLYLVNKLHCREIAKTYNVSISTIQRCLYRNKIPLRQREYRKYPINEKFFSKWSNDNAYIIGFITADGCISGKRVVEIGISAKDVALLKYIKDIMGIENPIYSSINKKSGKEINSLSFSSAKIVKDLSKYNIIPRKTGKEKLPKIPKKYHSQYLLGLFDGDGCICFNKRPKGPNTYRIKFSICSANEKFLQDIKKNIGFNLGIVCSLNKIYEWKISKHKDIERIYNFMYKNAGFFYKRKRDIFEKIIEHIYRENRPDFIGMCPENLIGQTFKSWTVLRRSPIDKGKRAKPKWICKCKCGFERGIDSWSLKKNRFVQCMNCYKEELKKHKLQLRG